MDESMMALAEMLGAGGGALAPAVAGDAAMLAPEMAEGAMAMEEPMADVQADAMAELEALLGQDFGGYRIQSMQVVGPAGATMTLKAPKEAEQ